jgi:hypothetical protein
MKAGPSGLSVILMAAAIAAVVLMSFVAVHLAGQPPAPLKETAEVPQEPTEASLPPSLDCAFHNFTRTAAVVSFYFDVALPKGEQQPRFYERAVVSADGTRTNYAGDHRPTWTYSLDGDGKPTIISSDGATRIVLYGLKLGVAGVLPVEAGIRSNEYRNLGGECRQTNLGGSDH